MGYKTKRLVIYLVAAIILVTFILSINNPSFTGYSVSDDGGKGDKDVIKALQKDGEVDVIIKLKDPEIDTNKFQIKIQSKEERLEEKKDEIKKIQEEVLQTIDYVNSTDTKNETEGNFITGLFSTEEQPSLVLDYAYSTVSAISGRITVEGFNDLKKNPNVVRIEKDKTITMFLTDSVPMINASTVHAITVNGINITGAGETICIIDSGVNYSHLDLGGCFGAGCKVIGGYDFVNNDEDPIDDNGHGTHVSGIVAANGTLKGVAPDARIISIKVLDSAGNGDDSNLLKAIDWCVHNASIFNISVITMSLGDSVRANSSYCDGASTPITSSINNAIAQNILVTVASGNNGFENKISWPACVANSTSVGSVYKSDSIAGSSNIASILDILAPGDSIYSTVPSGYGTMSGTSMATPHMAGSAALLRQYQKLVNNKTLSTTEIKDLLKKGGKIIPVSRLGYDYNFSRVNVLGAINLISSVNETGNSITDRETQGKITFNSGVDLYNASVAFVISDNFIYLNSTAYPSLNVSANLTFYNLPYLKLPVIYKDGTVCLDCSLIGYFSNDLSFSVTGFSNYTSGPNAQLNISDAADNGTAVYKWENLSFYANYTNVTSGVPISTGNCNISFDNGDNGTMSYNGTLQVFVYVKNFTRADLYDYNVTCYDSTFETLTAFNNINVLPLCWLNYSNSDWIVENKTVICQDENVFFNNQTLIVRNATFVLINSSLVLNQSPGNKFIWINESANFSAYNSSIQSKVSLYRFNLNGYGQIILVNTTFNKSILYTYNQSEINYSNFYDSIFFSSSNNYLDNCNIFADINLFGNSVNHIKNSVFYDLVYFQANSINTINNSKFLDPATYVFAQDNSYTEIINSSFDILTLSLEGSSKMNFTKPGSIINASSLDSTDTPTVYGYVDMPVTGNILAGTLNRYYPVLVLYTNGSPVINKQVNITNNSVVVWSGTTDSEGIAYPNLTFGLASYDNNTPWLNVSVNPTKDIGLLTDTPIIFYLNVGPGVYLIEPYNNSVIQTLTTQAEVNFSFNFTDDNLTNNCSLYLDGILNQTNDTTLNNTITYFPENVSVGNHNWYVNCSDGQYETMSDIWNFTIAQNFPPNITLNNPADNATIYNRTIPFNFTPIDDLNNTLICSIYIDGTLNQTNISINNTPTIFRINLTGTHSWSVNCSDGQLSNVSETRTVTAIYCGDFIANGPEQCDNSDLRNESCASLGYDQGTISCTSLCRYTGCSNNDGGGSGGGGGGPIIPPTHPPTVDPEDNTTPSKPPEVIVIPKNKTEPKKIESPAVIPVVNVEASPKNAGVLMLTGLILLSVWTLIFPILYFGRKCFAEDHVIERLIKEERINHYRKLFVTKEVYEKYIRILEIKDKRCNLEKIKLKKDYYPQLARLKAEFEITEELAKLIIAAKKGYWNAILTKEKISEKLRKKFKHIKFENPFRE